MDFLQINKFSSLHNGENIIFCKTDYIKTEFKNISKIKNDVILISGNSDINIDHTYISLMPDNLKLWFCQNNLLHHDKLKCIPIGLENTFKSKRREHGVGWKHAIQKINLLSSISPKVQEYKKRKLLYANFSTQSNVKDRAIVKEVCLKSDLITFDEPNLAYNDLITRFLEHEAVICPIGNGIDTHRIYEVLYCGRVPVIFKAGNYPIYLDIYSKLPIVILDDPSELFDRERMQYLIQQAKIKPSNKEILDFQYWSRVILEEAGHIDIRKINFFKSLVNRKNN